MMLLPQECLPRFLLCLNPFEVDGCSYRVIPKAIIRGLLQKGSVPGGERGDRTGHKSPTIGGDGFDLRHFYFMGQFFIRDTHPTTVVINVRRFLKTGKLIEFSSSLLRLFSHLFLSLLFSYLFVFLSHQPLGISTLAQEMSNTLWVSFHTSVPETKSLFITQCYSQWPLHALEYSKGFTKIIYIRTLGGVVPSLQLPFHLKSFRFKIHRLSSFMSSGVWSTKSSAYFRVFVNAGMVRVNR